MTRPKRATIRQVAEHAKVSPMTVSNFVNGRFELMTPEMREKVGRSVKALNYRRNYGAHLLRTSKLWSIGIIVVDASDHYLSDGYTTQIISGISNKLNENGFSTMLQGVKPDQFDKSTMFRNVQTDGLCVLLSGTDQQRAQQFAVISEFQQPTVLFLESFSDAPDTICSILQDDYSAARLLARHVLARAPGSILILTSGENEWAAVNQRVAGMSDEIHSSGIAGRLDIIPSGNGRQQDVIRALETHVTANGYPDAVMCINDEIALGVLKALRQAGVAVPGQTCVTGFNAFGLHDITETALTTMQSPAYEMGRIGAQELLQALDVGHFSQKTLTLPIEMLEGDSA
ncbi:LacI family DNA-binding transcriptional regulator [uncultured Roseovarius sp.]|uniref:LacI family DNA-binding transcriptional regulator n=1 Tax=uncultured Roseovarius sp. TaxID=293344 RepID=UPI00262CC77D|nr:LacI family DNA-binding transcriptional regulator [uncultured Roseovarius sp.]